MELENRTRGSRASPENGGLNRSSGSLIADTNNPGRGFSHLIVIDTPMAAAGARATATLLVRAAI